MAEKTPHLDNISIIYDKLRSEIEEDKLYWLRNDAKFRAVHSSKNYEEFKNIVDAAHLVPLKKEDKVTKKENGNYESCNWNKAINK